MKILSFAMLVFAGVSLLAVPSVSARAPENIDCSSASLKEAEKSFQRQIKELFLTTGDQYNGKIADLERTENRRAHILRDWLKTRCECRLKSMSQFEKNLCQASYERGKATLTNACLVR